MPQCPWYVPTRSPFSEYQQEGTWSLEHEKRRSPSRLYLIIVSARSWPFTMIGRIFPMAPRVQAGGAGAQAEMPILVAQLGASKRHVEPSTWR